MVKRFVINYLQRHQHPLNQALHLVGVPLTFIGSAVLLCQAQFVWACAAFVVGYLLQFAGHWIEGNDAGEVILLKRALGIPYVDIVSRSDSIKQPNFEGRY